MPSAVTVQPSRRLADQCALLLLLAWLPSLAFAGHWSDLATPVTGGMSTHESHASPDPHERHCHADLDGCAGGASMSTLPPTPIQQVAPLSPAPIGGRLADEDLTPAGRSVVPVTPPPRDAR